MSHQIYYKKGRGYQLVTPDVVDTPIKGFHIKHELYELMEDGKLILRNAYGWDGATFFPDFRWIIRSSAYHDVFYRMIALGDLPIEMKKPVDKFLRDVCIEDGAPKWMAFMVYRGVRLNRKPGDDPIYSSP